MRVRFKYAIYKCATNGFCTYQYRDLDKEKTIICTGINLPKTKIEYDFNVEEIEHPKYGHQYKVLSYSEHVETDKESIINYLSSGLIKGIGKSLAERIYKTFKADTLVVLEKEPEKLLKVKGISKSKLEKIISSYEENHIPKDVINFFQKYNFSADHIFKFYKEYKSEILDKVKDNPYRLCKFRGVTFNDVDIMKNDLEIKDTNENRIYAACIEMLKNYTSIGMVGCEKNDLLLGVSKLTDISDIHLLWKIIINLINKEKIAYKKVTLNGKICQYFYIPEFKRIEEELAELIYQITNKKSDISKLAMSKIKNSSIVLDFSQEQAVINCFKSNLSIISGGPGTGKTTSIKEVVRIFKELYPEKMIYLMAPTGLASRRMEESTNESASTIHNGLKLGVHFDDQIEYTDEALILEDGLLIIDEMSMVGMMLAHKVFKCCHNMRIVLVGDVNQLPSVESGNVLKDIIDSGIIPVSYLLYTHRQGEGSSICENAHLINSGNNNLITDEEFKIHYHDGSMKELQDKMVDAYLTTVKDGKYKSIMCLAPYKNHDCGVYELNNAIQDKINPLNNRNEVKGLNGMRFRVGDKVMHITKNTEDVVNGDTGEVIDIYYDNQQPVIVVEYNTAHKTITYEYTRSNINELTLAYAITYHKSQGSEAEKVILCMTDFHRMMLKRKILYTGITRAKKNVELFTSSEALLKKVIDNTEEKSRNTLLAFLIKEKIGDKYEQYKLAL